MPSLSRRRFIAISAAAALAGPAAAAPKRYWSGTAPGARASIPLDHPDAAKIVTAVLQEIDRLEDVFSLYRPGSALSRLSRDGSLDVPPFELVECLGIADAGDSVDRIHVHHLVVHPVENIKELCRYFFDPVAPDSRSHDQR